MKRPRGSCVLAFAPHSGWAAVVAIGGTPGKPLVLARERLELADETLPGARQPYHVIEPLPLARASARLAVFRESAAALATSGVGTLVATARAAGIEPIAAGILDSSGRDPGALEAILASHALIHTADGNHFREALANACAALKLPCARVRQRDLPAEAARALRRTSRELTATVARLGRAAGSPWGADQKSAALLACLLLARGV
ncbi:MAG TPA: hypothetical protein VLV25_04200 [Steroidobacteraceae bacterium]|nr:hypothetical protein [Steroidobacteraceae bacterium]